jgi:hypothetical protein
VTANRGVVGDGSAVTSFRTLMLFVDGQNLLHSCRRLFGSPHCHPHLLAAEMARAHAVRSIGCRFYTGRPDPNREPARLQRLDRQLAVMRAAGVTVITRQLRYHWDWGHREQLPRAGVGVPPVTVQLAPYERPQEKGIDSAIALDVVELALLGAYDVGVVVSLDRDLHEIPATLHRLRHLLPRPVRLEAAVPVRAGRAKTVPGFAATRLITPAVFARVRDDTWYADPAPGWRRPEPPQPWLAGAAAARR